MLTEAINIFNSFSRVFIPVLFCLDIWLTHLVKKYYPNIKSGYYKMQKNIGEAKLILMKGLYVLFTFWCTSDASFGIGRSPDFAIPLVYILVVLIYILEFLRYRWRVQHGFELSMEDEFKEDKQASK